MPGLALGAGDFTKLLDVRKKYLARASE